MLQFPSLLPCLLTFTKYKVNEAGLGMTWMVNFSRLCETPHRIVTYKIYIVFVMLVSGKMQQLEMSNIQQSSQIAVVIKSEELKPQSKT